MRIKDDKDHAGFNSGQSLNKFPSYESTRQRAQSFTCQVSCEGCTACKMFLLPWNSGANLIAANLRKFSVCCLNSLSNRGCRSRGRIASLRSGGRISGCRRLRLHHIREHYEISCEELTAHLVQCFSGFFLRVTVQGHGSDLLTDDLKVEVEHLVPSAHVDKYPSCFLPELFRVFVAKDSTSATSCHFERWATVSQWQCTLLDAALDLLPECGQSSILSGP